jgi:C-terminal processing protease CtpA/Prc
VDVTVPTTTQAERDKALPEPSAEWALRIDGKTAVLTLPTFAFWGRSFDAAGFVARSWGALREVPQLIIDIRRCEGGDDGLTRKLLAYLLRREASLPAMRQESAYERVPYDLARYLDTWDFSFFDRTGQVTPGPDRAGRKTWLVPNKAPLRIEPVATPYAGRAVLLVGPVNSSAGFQLARDAKATGAATLIGQSTGGNLRGLNGGQVAWINLPHSGVGIDIPLLASYAADDLPDSGVLPDVAVAPSFADAQAGVDTEMQAALRWLNG